MIEEQLEGKEHDHDQEGHCCFDMFCHTADVKKEQKINLLDDFLMDLLCGRFLTFQHQAELMIRQRLNQ